MTGVVLVPAGLLFACSGPGAGAAIAENIAYAQAHAVVVLTALEVSALIWLLRAPTPGMAVGLCPPPAASPRLDGERS